MAYPVSFKLAKYANGYFSAGVDIRELQLGDSITTEGSSVSQIPLGRARTLRRSGGWGSFHRGAATGPNGALYDASDGTFPSYKYIDAALSSANASNNVGTNISKSPGQTWANGESGFHPNLAFDWRANANAADGSTLYRIDFGGWGTNLMDLDNWANGNPWTGEVTARIMYHGHAANNSGVPIKITGRRNSAATGSTSSFTPETADQLHVRDVVIAAGATHPGIALLGGANNEYNGGVDSLHLHIVGAGCFASSGGVRTPGYFGSYIADGGWTTANVLAALGGGASPTCGTTYVRQFLQYGSLMPNRICHWYGQNATAAETTDFAGGGYTVFKAGAEAIIDAMDAHMAALGITEYQHLLVSGYEAGTDAYNVLKSQAMFEIAKERANVSFVSLHEIMPANPFPSVSPNPWWLHTDNVHPTTTGASLAAMALMAMMRAAVDAEVYEARAARQILRMGL